MEPTTPNKSTDHVIISGGSPGVPRGRRKIDSRSATSGPRSPNAESIVTLTSARRLVISRDNPHTSTDAGMGDQPANPRRAHLLRYQCGGDDFGVKPDKRWAQSTPNHKNTPSRVEAQISSAPEQARNTRVSNFGPSGPLLPCITARQSVPADSDAASFRFGTGHTIPTLFEHVRARAASLHDTVVESLQEVARARADPFHEVADPAAADKAYWILNQVAVLLEGVPQALDGELREGCGCEKSGRDEAVVHGEDEDEDKDAAR
ncbi:uncharacterized protein JN550_009736 [Neoarthrinium moseri]|uniref:uncharacterized protein n=1 Tax=Neoarthrinium moseri TaxID=1658444 RepID=UPI001FDDEC6F|nr:uncharacterized protein JN550_009736 [Neoarthrinium moseri]KAI1863210.1 hypothetical protein JN550_009736 [Neoarthrinium moseri]